MLGACCCGNLSNGLRIDAGFFSLVLVGRVKLGLAVGVMSNIGFLLLDTEKDGEEYSPKLFDEKST